MVSCLMGDSTALASAIVRCCPNILEMILGFLRIPIDLGFIKISTYMLSGYSASNDLSSFLPCFAVLCGYLIVFVFAGLGLLKRQDVK